MKNKIKKFFAAIILVAVMISSLQIEVKAAAAKTLKLGSAENVPAYVAGTYFTTKTTSSGKYVYCLNIHKATAANTTATLVKEKDAGFAYLIENGYPHKKFTGERLKDYYITQTAIWWYLDDTTGSSNLTKSFKTNGSDKYNLRPYIKKLVTNAKKAKEKGYVKTKISTNISNKNMNLSSDKKNYISNEITVNSTNIDKYTVSITSAPSGTQIVDTNGNATKTFKAGKKFKIKVPASKINASTNIKISVKATGSIGKAYEYQPSDKSMQNVIPAYLTAESKTVTDTVTLNINYEQPSQVSIIKLDKANGKALAGAKMVLKDSNGKTIDSWTTDGKEHVIKNLANGTYKVAEIEAPANYKLNKEEVTFTINNSTKIQTVKFYNEAEDKIINIIKLDKANDKALAGAKMVLKDASGKTIDSWTTDGKAHVVKNLANGTYKVAEIEAPANYKLNKEEVTFTVTDSTKTQTIKFYNETEDKVVNIIKLDKKTEQPVAGAKLSLRDSNNKEITNWITTTQGHIIKNLPNGTYKIVELEAPAGYKLNEQAETFTITDQNKNLSVKFYNEVKDRVVNITKIDAATGLPLAGAEIVVRNENDEEVARFTSTEDAYVITNIEDGTYTVEEESAPEGYLRSEEIITFTIDADHLSQQITIKNYKEVIVPDTSSNSSILFTIIGLSIIGLGIGYVRKNEQKIK